MCVCVCVKREACSPVKDVASQDALGRGSGDFYLGRRRDVGLGVLC